MLSPIIRDAMLEAVVESVNRDSPFVMAELTDAGKLLLSLNDSPHTQLTLEVEAVK